MFDQFGQGAHMIEVAVGQYYRIGTRGAATESLLGNVEYCPGGAGGAGVHQSPRAAGLAVAGRASHENHVGYQGLKVVYVRNQFHAGLCHLYLPNVN